MTPSRPQETTLRDTILASVSRELDITPDDILGSRAPRAIDARWIAIWLLGDAIEYPDLAKLFGVTGATVEHACERVWVKPELLAVAQTLLAEHREELRNLAAVSA